MKRTKMYRGATPNIFSLARRSRKTPTSAEQILWEKLRGRRLSGFKFRRQHPIANFIVDFFCAEHGLAVEVDGEYHNHNEQRHYDEQRTIKLNTLNIKVLRFTNNDVVSNIDLVLKQIEHHLKSS